MRGKAWERGKRGVKKEGGEREIVKPHSSTSGTVVMLNFRWKH